MSKRTTAIGAATIMCLLLLSASILAQRAPRTAQGRSVGSTIRPQPVTLSGDRQAALVQQYCAGCHNAKAKTGGLDLTSVDFNRLEQHAEIAEKVIRKLRAGLMPPPGSARPEPEVVTSLLTSLESTMDRAAANRPNPGNRALQRLNRAEYANSVRDLLGIDVDVAALLPPDSMGRGFDNIADAMTLSPALMEGYIRAASKISRLAIGDLNAAPMVATFTMPRTASQMRHVDGAPFGTRGGIAVNFTFPADGEYIFRMEPFDDSNGLLVGTKFAEGEQMEVSINGERVALLDIDPKMTVTNGGVFVQTEPIRVTAGSHRVAAAFIERFAGPNDDLISPIEQTLVDTEQGAGEGITLLPHLKNFAIRGPFEVTGIADTESRRRIFTCRPTSAAEESRCAGEIVRSLATRAYRRAVTPEDLEGLLSFYRQSREGGDFEAGIRGALEAVLASPYFVFRLEREPAAAKAGQSFRINDQELASRLSYFLWSTPPDSELMLAAARGKLSDPVALEGQVRRMLADPRSEALSTRFAAQWLHLSDLDTMHPDPLYFPQFDQTLAASMRRETEMLFDSIVREDQNILGLLTSDQTFVDERLAKHYGIPNIEGNRMRRVKVTQDYRKGLLGQGSILTLTSIADRTSPVARGKFVMEVLLGTPPPPPPPVVPDLNETKAIQGEKLLTLRQRMESHRASSFCAGCHKIMDPIGLALENFDVTGRWRDLDAGSPIDPTGQLYDGARIDGPNSLREALLRHSDLFIQNVAEKLMMYGISRRVEYTDMPAVRAIVREAARSDNRFSSFVLGIVKSPQFLMRSVQETSSNQN